MLEALLSGGCWSPDRIGKLHGSPVVPCALCGQHGTDDLHTYWTCPELSKRVEEEVKSTQYLVQAATEGIV